MGTKLTPAVGSAVAAIVFLFLGLTRYPLTGEERFMRFVYGPPMPYIPVWWQVGLGLAFECLALACWYRVSRRLSITT